MKQHMRRQYAVLVGVVIATVALLRSSGVADCPAQAATPVTAQASPEAATLLRYLASIDTEAILSGQSNYLEAPDAYSTMVHALTGTYPAIAGFELGAISGQSEAQVAAQRQAVIASATAWWHQGGIVELHWHAGYPGAPGYDWSYVNGGPFPPSIVLNSVTPGTAAHAALLADLDRIAGYLAQLRDAQVPVLWRPYHEMNGGWFWWGQQGAFADLWQVMYERFVQHHQLTNLLWVWSPGAYDPLWTTAYETYYPGDRYVDVVAIDSYAVGYPVADYTDLLPVAMARPVGYSESGDLPDPAVLQTQQPRMAFFITWTNFLVDPATKNTPAWVRYVYTHPYVLTRDELPDLTTSRAASCRTAPAGPTVPPG